MIESALFTELTTNVDIAAKVQQGSIFHVYPIVLPEGIDLSNGYAISYNRIVQDRVYPSLKVDTYQINCFGSTNERALALAQDVDDALNYQTEHLLGGTDAVTFVEVTNSVPLYDDVSKLYYTVVELTIKY